MGSRDVKQGWEEGGKAGKKGGETGRGCGERKQGGGVVSVVSKTA
jgi:hypothetical protein